MKTPDTAALNAFPHSWLVEVLNAAPLITPARQYTYPLQVVGEEDALARGALYLLVRPAPGIPAFLATCALGFRDPSMPTGVYSMPNPVEICAVAGGYAYLIQTDDPAQSLHVPMKPVMAILPIPSRDLILFVGFHMIHAYGSRGAAWVTSRLSWEGIRLGEVTGDLLYGHGWNMRTDREVEFTVDLRTGEHVGGGFVV